MEINMFVVLLAFLLLLGYNSTYIFKPLTRIRKSTAFVLIILLAFFFAAYATFEQPTIRYAWHSADVLANAQAYSGQNPHGYTSYMLYSSVILFFSLVKFLVGSSVILAVLCNILLSMVTLFLIFYLMYMLFNNEHAALVSMVLVGIIYHYIGMATDTYTTMIALFYFLLSLIFFWLFITYNKWTLNALFLITLGLTILSRFEYILIVPVFFILWIFLKRENLHVSEHNLRYWIINFLCVIVIFLPLFVLNYIPTIISWYTRFDKQSIPTDMMLLKVSGFFMNRAISPSGIIFSFLLIIFTIISVKWIIRKQKLREAIFLFGMGGTFWLFFLTRYVGQLGYYHIPTYVCFSIIIALAIVQLYHKIPQTVKPFILVAGIVSMLFLLHVSFGLVLEHPMYAWPERHLLTQTSSYIESHVPKNCVTYTIFHSYIGMGTKRRVVTLGEIAENEALRPEQFPCAYYYNDSFCSENWCKQAYALFNATYVLRPVLFFKDNNFTFTLSKVYLNEELAKQDNLAPPEVVVINKNPEFYLLSCRFLPCFSAKQLMKYRYF